MTPNPFLLTFNGLTAALAEPLPGLSAQLEMAPVPRPSTVAYPDAPPDSVPAAVLVLIYPRRGEPHIVFIRRPSTSIHHKDQIAFPGGQIEGAESPVQAALREAEEEVGVRRAQVHVVGSLTPLYIPPSGFCVTPVVGLAAKAPDFVPFPEEVAEIPSPICSTRLRSSAKNGIWSGGLFPFRSTPSAGTRYGAPRP
jgi:8-oxo-dGTP pyrophosphatase MutT (NUDIX family)